MRGAPDTGSIKQVCEVEPCEGGFRGRLSIPFDGTRFTEVRAWRHEAQIDLDALKARILTKPVSTGFSAQQHTDINAALARQAARKATQAQDAKANGF